MKRRIAYNAADVIKADTAAAPYLRPSFTSSNKLRRVAWKLCWLLFFPFIPRPLHAWRAMLLRAFGATMGPNCHFYPRSKVWAPWNLICADQVTAADGTEIYIAARIQFGSHAIVSQRSNSPQLGACIRVGSASRVSLNRQLDRDLLHPQLARLLDDNGQPFHAGSLPRDGADPNGTLSPGPAGTRSTRARATQAHSLFISPSTLNSEAT
jgi:hypothetical protein